MNRKLASLHNWDKDCAEVIVWFLKNKETNEFARRVDLPAVVGVTVRDKRYVDAVETCFSTHQLKACESVLLWFPYILTRVIDFCHP